MLTRRNFLATAAAGLAVPHAFAQTPSRKRIAFLGTEVRRHSHAQHFLDRMTLGYSWDGRWQTPRVEVASVFVDQFPEEDLARDRIRRHGLKQFPSVAEALTLGASELAVDGIIIIAEHGRYPRNDKGQTLYPRYEWFKEVVKVFERSGRSVPVFNDKHLSTTWDQCVEMVADSKRLGFPFLAGSSLPVTWRLPEVEMPFGTPLSESVCIGYGGVDSYDFHGLETAQCMSERRRGGEVGIRHVHALRGPALWEALAADGRSATRELIVAALNRSHNLPVEGGYPTAPVSFEWARKALAESTGYLIEHSDGFRTTMILARIRDFNYAGLRSDTGETISCQMYLPMPGHSATTADFFNPLVRHIEDLVIQGKAPYPVERTLLTSGMVIAAVDSLHQDRGIDTPEMQVAYQALQASHFRRT